MRIGNNPEKSSKEENILKAHRIIVVFYNPDSDEDYFKELDIVLDKCLESIIKTINFQTTNITLINNNSSEKVNSVVNKYIEKIDKYIIYKENKGKVYPILSEVRSVYEPFVTIADADVLFFNGWEKAVFNIFTKYNKIGVVSPLPYPNGAFYLNSFIFGQLFYKIKFGKIIKNEDSDFLKTINQWLYKRDNREDWNEKHFYLDNDLVIGATHFVATYRSELFRNIYSYPNYKFKPGYETEFIDKLSELCGYYKCSTGITFAYHIGNKMDEFTLKYTFDKRNIIKIQDFINIPKYKTINKFALYFGKNFGKFLIKYYFKKLK